MLANLEKIERQLQGSKWRRILSYPFRYFCVKAYLHLYYPLTKRTKSVSRRTFFDVDMILLLPAGIDLYLFGAKSHSSEIRLAKYLLKTLCEGDTYIDVGAHFGYFSLLTAKIVGQQGCVLAIEAAPNTFKVLEENTSKFKQIEVLNIACSDKKGTISFYEFPTLYSEYNTLYPKQYDNEEWVGNNKAIERKIKTYPIDDIVAEKEPIPKVVKIDVEGAELEVINGMKNLLSKGEGLSVVMEFLADERKNQKYFQAANVLEKYQFYPHIIDEYGVLTSINISDVTQFFSDNKIDSENIVFQHKK